MGRVVFRAPKGLVYASLNTFPADETIAYKTRPVEGGPLKSWGGGELGTLDTDREGIRIIAYRAPTVVASIKTEGGEPAPADATVHPVFLIKGFSYGENVIRQEDGRFRTRSLMPEHEYEFEAWAWAKGYVPKRFQRVNLPEGAPPS
jgi:hypothetical protein